MLRTVDTVSKRERELQFSKKNSSNKRCLHTIFCRQCKIVEQLGEREYSIEIEFICDIQKINKIDKHRKDRLYNLKKLYSLSFL